jgi:hypothetical protein
MVIKAHSDAAGSTRCDLSRSPREIIRFKGLVMLRHVTAAIFSIILLSPAAEAATVRYVATLSGASEVPPNASTGTGQVILDIVDELSMSLSVTFSGLTGTTTIAHIHNAPAGINGPIMTSVPSFPGFPTGVTEGSYAQTLDLSLASTWNPAFITSSGGTADGAKAIFLSELAQGEAYFNLHSSAFPGGELRGQLSAVPLPPALSFALLGFAALGVAGRRRGARSHS